MYCLLRFFFAPAAGQSLVFLAYIFLRLRLVSYTLQIFAQNFEISVWPITVVFLYKMFSVLWQALILFIAQNFSAPAANLKFDLQFQQF